MVEQKKVVLVKFDPYVPQCIQFGTLLDPSAQRFAVKGASQRKEPSQTPKLSQMSALSQTSLQIKPSRRHIEAQGLQKTDSHPTEESVPSTHPVTEAPSSPFEDTVKDSFTMPSSDPVEALEPKPTNRFNDALSQAILETKALAHLPLDDDEDAESLASSGAAAEDDSGTDEEPLTMAPKPPKNFSIVSKASALRDKGSINQNAFQCMDPGANGYTSYNPNARTIQILEEMGKHYDQMQDSWRTLSYRKCVTALKKQTVKITTAKQAAALPFIGPRLADKIEEIVLTDRLRRLDSTRDDPLDVVLRLFLGVYGAGLVQANKWIQAGYRTLEDLRTKAKLTESQQVGNEHYDDFNSRIPRAEVEAHGAVVIKELKKIDPKFTATIMGSYRRGTKDSGDIDMIITRPDTSLAVMHTTVFEVLVPHLYKTGFLKASLTTSRSNDPTGSKWHGASCLPNSKVWRRIDLLLVPEDEMGAALLYFTGNDIFNRSIRLLARKKNMRLNQKGLYKDVQRGRRGEKLNDGVLVESRSERKIFEVLGVPWREPHERIC
jgi:DNA polymerase IV